MTEIFVFGSNVAGRHGKGAALYARKKKGAIYGRGEGRQGESYAIPTKDEHLIARPIDGIADSIAVFIDYALRHPELTFRVTPVGCGLAGFSREQIKPLFEAFGPMPSNCFYSPEWASP